MEAVYPPRPKSRILPARLPSYEKTGKWVVQRKFNGTRINVYIHGDAVRLFHKGRSPRQFHLTERLKCEILSLKLDPNSAYWLDGELLDAKTKTPAYKGTVVLSDVLQAGE